MFHMMKDPPTTPPNGSTRQPDEPSSPIEDNSQIYSPNSQDNNIIITSNSSNADDSGSHKPPQPTNPSSFLEHRSKIYSQNARGLYAYLEV